MKNYNEAGNASSIQLGTMNHFGYNNYPFSLENEEKALAILNDIYEVDGENLSGMKLKMAIAVSKEFANGVQATQGDIRMKKTVLFEENYGIVIELAFTNNA